MRPGECAVRDAARRGRGRTASSRQWLVIAVDEAFDASIHVLHRGVNATQRGGVGRRRDQQAAHRRLVSEDALEPSPSCQLECLRHAPVKRRHVAEVGWTPA